MMFIFQTGFKVATKVDFSPSNLNADAQDYQKTVRLQLEKMGASTEQLKSMDSLHKEGKLTWRAVKDIIGESLWQKFQIWWKQQELGKELLDGLPKAEKTPDATRRANEKKLVENVTETTKEGEKEKGLAPPIPKTESKKDSTQHATVTKDGIKQD